MIQNTWIIFIWLNNLTDGYPQLLYLQLQQGCLFKCLTFTHNREFNQFKHNIRTMYKYNKCSEKLLVCEGFIVVKITVSFPPAKISRGGVGNICKYLGKQGFNFFFQTFKFKLHQKVPVCIRYL